MPAANALMTGLVTAVLSRLPPAALAAAGDPLALVFLGLVAGAGIQSVLDLPTVTAWGAGLLGVETGAAAPAPQAQESAPAAVRRRKSSIFAKRQSGRLSSVSDAEIVEEEEASFGAAGDSGELGSPLPQWPDSPVNCYSEPTASDFKVRGPNYLKDKVKIPSGNAAFPCRGVDLWLSDNAMSNIARHPSMLGGKLDDKPTLCISFLMPWGNLVGYFEIPEVIEPKSTAVLWDK